MLRLRGVHKTYGRGATAVPALRGVDLDVLAGELVILAGPSGCGKTTLIEIASGVLDADEGSVTVDGIDWRSLDRESKTKRRSELVGFVFQQFNLVPTLRADENVAVPLLIRGVTRRRSLGAAGEALGKVGLAARTTAAPAELSGGMQQRVAIARALVTRPRLLVCDEPTANLDGVSGRSVMELLRASTDGSVDGEQRCVIIVTHDSRIFEYADRIVRMEDGRLTGATAGLAHRHHEEG
ncbi:MAG: ABC transporter ATP-binding protein [Phycisphaerae bacterium]|nr:ABC transporter ATP-binding protein [Phycisphaerae bacterium]